MPTTHLPSPMEVHDLLEALLDRQVTVSNAPALAPGRASPVSVATYVDDSLQVLAVSCLDLALSAHAAACLGLLPPSTAEACLHHGTLDRGLTENLYEVLNVAASLLNVHGADHVRLYALHPAGGPLPPDLQARAMTLGRRLDLSVEIAGYGAGQWSTVLCPA